MSLLKRLFGKEAASPAYSPELAALLAASREELDLKMAAHQMGWGLSDVLQWNLDQSEGILRLTLANGLLAQCPAQVVGSYDGQARSWMWAWANPSINDELKASARRVQEYGKQHQMTQLTRGEWKAEEADAWAMTALTAKLTQAQGAYRGGAGARTIYFVFGEVKLSNSGNPSA